MRVKESDLPGVGKRYGIHLAEGRHLVLIIHHSGRRELYFLNDPDDDEPKFTVSLKDDEARSIGSLLLGADYQPVSDERMEFMLQNLLVAWLEVAQDSPLANRTIGEVDVKKNTGVTIIAIKRGDDVIPSPGSGEYLRPGDLLMVVGRRDQLKNTEQVCQNQGLCAWME